MAADIRLKKTFLFLIALSAYMNAYIFFSWDTFMDGRIRNIVVVLRHLGWGLMFLYSLLYGCKRTLSAASIVLLLELMLTAAIACYAGTRSSVVFNLGYFIAVIIFIAACLISDEDKAGIFMYMLKIFAIMVAPGAIYYITTVILNIHIPYSVLESDHISKYQMGIYYELRPFGLIARNRWQAMLPRYCGVFDEPGVVGTLAALYYSAIIHRKDMKVWKIVLLIEGLFSFSLAFYLLIVVVYCIRLVQSGFVKLIIGFSLLLFAGVLFFSVDFQSEQLRNIQKRFDFSSGVLFKDNRTSASFDEAYEGFNDSDNLRELVFGYGFNYVESQENMASSYSYKMLILNHGYLGVLLYVGFFILYVILIKRPNEKNVCFIVAFLTSIYQRPYVMSQQYILLFLTALAFTTETCDNYIPAVDCRQSKIRFRLG